MDDATRMRYHDAFGRTGLGSVASAALAELIRVGGGPSPIIASTFAKRLGVSRGSVDAALCQMVTKGMIARAGKVVTLLEPQSWKSRDRKSIRRFFPARSCVKVVSTPAVPSAGNR